MSVDKQAKIFEKFINNSRSNKIKFFLIENFETYKELIPQEKIKDTTKEAVVECLLLEENIKELIIKNIKQDEMMDFMFKYHQFRECENIKNNKTCIKNIEKFETLAKQGNAVFFMIDVASMKFTFSKGKGLKTLGLKDDEVVGKDVADYYGNNESIMNGIKQASEGKKRHGVLDQGCIHFDVNFAPIFDDNGQVMEVVGMAYDVSERVEGEKKLEIMNEKLREADATKDKIFSIIAHDLRSPLSGILGCLSLLEIDLENQDIGEIKEKIEIVNNSTKNIYKLLENLLIWLRTQQGNTQFKPEKFNLQDEEIEQIDLLKELAKEKNIDLINEISEDIIINIDKNVINTIIRNLVSNAIKFTGGLGKTGKVVISSRIEGNYILVSVSDDGVGMTDEQKDNLFKINTISSTFGTANEFGTGLGLLLCKDLIEKHGGKIRIDHSEPMIGTTIKFNIPIG